MTKYYLAIDGGNTLTKYALFDRAEKLLAKTEVDCSAMIESHGLNSSNTICALVNVARVKKGLESFPLFDVADYFVDGRFLEMPVNYSETLGLDRLILAYLFYDQSSATALVDSGTFTTVDFVDPQGFQGGHIFPGLDLLMENYEMGFKLKRLRPRHLLKGFVAMPKTSHDAMASGIARSFVEPVQSALRDLKFDKAVFTGGNGQKLCSFFDKYAIQQRASIHFDADLVHLALLKFLRKVVEAR